MAVKKRTRRLVVKWTEQEKAEQEVALRTKELLRKKELAEQKVARREAELAQINASLAATEAALTEWRRVTMLVKHDLEHGADPELLIEMLVIPYRDKHGKRPEDVKIIDEYMAAMRREAKTQTR